MHTHGLTVGLICWWFWLGIGASIFVQQEPEYTETGQTILSLLVSVVSECWENSMPLLGLWLHHTLTCHKL
jgi:hypothetical protein